MKITVIQNNIDCGSPLGSNCPVTRAITDAFLKLYPDSIFSVLVSDEYTVYRQSPSGESFVMVGDNIPDFVVDNIKEYDCVGTMTPFEFDIVVNEFYPTNN